VIPSALQAIPDDLRHKLEKLRPYLERTGGSIRPRERDGVYCLRIRVPHPDYGRVHKSVRIGDEGAAYAVQTLIDGWRQEYDARQAKEEHKGEEERAYNAKLKELKRTVLAQARGPSHRRRLACEFDKAAENPMELYFYLLGGGSLPEVPRRPGPKPRSGLC
jgi:hypothetical protein